MIKKLLLLSFPKSCPVSIFFYLIIFYIDNKVNKEYYQIINILSFGENMNNIELTNLKNENRLPFQVIGTKMNFEQNDIHRLNGFHYHQFVWFSQGNGIIKYNGNAAEIKSGTVVFIPKGTPHEYHKITSTWKSNWICFSGWACDKLLNESELTDIKFISVENEGKILSLMSSINTVMKEDLLYSAELASSLLYSLIIEMNRIHNNITDKYDKINCSQINKALRHIDKNYFNKITMNELCGIANLSEPQFCRLFKKHLNMRPMEYLLKVRLRKAKQLLIETDLSILDIAESVGYDNPTYFSMLFKREIGISPSDFRKLMM